MNKYIMFMFFVMTFLSCEKKDETIVDGPQWLNEMITGMESENTFIAAEIWRYTWNGEYIYELTSPIFSCLYCNVFYSDGSRIDWEITNIDEFLAYRKERTFIWKEPELD